MITRRKTNLASLNTRPWLDVARITDELAAASSRSYPSRSVWRVLSNDRPTKNALEKKWIDTTREKLGQPSDLALLQKTFDRMK